jgi:acyl-CoA synthetase (AMP-forming)/AMP-acid ligase II
MSVRYGRRYNGRWVVADLLADRADRFGDDTAVSDADGTSVSYGRLAAGAATVAGALRSLGVEPGDRVATMLDPSVTYLETWFGSAWSGAIEVPVNTDFKGVFLEHVLRESTASVPSHWEGPLLARRSSRSTRSWGLPHRRVARRGRSRTPCT